MENNSQEAMIEKTITTSSLLNGGTLNRDQQNRFVMLVKDYSVMLSQVRFKRMRHNAEDIDRLHIGEPVSESADENTATAATFAPDFSQVPLDAKKLKSQWQITTETLQENIEQNNFEDTIMDGITRRIATDLEDLAFNGDSSLPATTPFNKLRRTLDGWDKKTEGAHIVDAGGKTIQKGIWSAAQRAMPKSYAADTGLIWMVSRNIWTDWVDMISDRQTPVGDNALSTGSGVTPFGIKAQMVPSIRDDLNIEAAGAEKAIVVGDRDGPFVIVTGSNDEFTLTSQKRDGTTTTGAVAITLPAGTFFATEIALEINSQMVTAGNDYLIADENAEGAIRLKTFVAGASSTITLAAGGNDALGTLGLTAAVTAGAVAGGDTPQGSYILLCNPKNLVWGQLDSTRMFTEFNKDNDRIESVIYNQLATAVENVNAVVKVKNIRSKDLIV